MDHILRTTPWTVLVLDRLDVSGNLHRITELDSYDPSRVVFVYHDLKAPVNEGVKKRLGPIQTVFHLAASTHVDRSIDAPMEFVMDNVVGTTNLLLYAREVGATVLYFSTDEVFGPAPGTTRYKEWDRYNSGNPYAASKAGAEEMCLAFANTYKMDVRITHTMNVYGYRQHPEKFIPSTIRKVLNGEKVIIHADPTKTKAGTRFYIDARHVASAVMFVEAHGKAGEKYNIVGEREVDNLTLAQMIARTVGKPLEYELVDFHSSRPGHDLRYGLCGDRLKEMGWVPPDSFEGSLADTVRWTLEHPAWL